MTKKKDIFRKIADHIITVLITGFIVSGIGFFIDFQFLKGRVGAVEKKVKSIPQIETKIDKVKGLMCEGEMMRSQIDKKVLEKYCVD